MKHSLKTKISLAIAMVSLLTVILVSFLSNYYIDEQFKKYIVNQQKQKTQQIVSNITLQYIKNENSWDLDYIHTIGMSALYEGYIIKITDLDNKVVWDAQAHDMSLCAQVINDITQRMRLKDPKLDGKFTTQVYPLYVNNKTIATLSILYYGPYFLSENDFRFLDALNIILAAIGVFSLFVSIGIGIYISKRLSQPLLKTAAATKQISDGNYRARINDITNTKELYKLISSVNHLAATLEKQEKLRKQLTEDVSHELRTPLAVLHSHIEAMIEGVWPPTPERLKGCLDEVGRIEKMVSDLENLAKVDSNNLKLSKTEFNLVDVIDKILNSFEIEIKNKNLQVMVGGQCSTIYADKDRIGQVVSNLISNAIKYTPNDGNIYIDVVKNKESICLNIQDNGIGIPENELPYIFERFYRADKSRNRNTGGSGIGLAIVKSIVKAHNGEISVESELGKGTKFVVNLPTIKFNNNCSNDNVLT